LGAALVSPSALALITTAFAEGDARNRALGVMGAVTSGGATAASIVGGVLTDLVHWRAIFLVNVPIGIVVAVAVTRLVGRRRPERTGRTDVAGAVLLTGGAVLVVTAVSRAEQGPGHLVGAAALAGLSLLGLFVWAERRAADPLVKLSMFRNPQVRLGNLICALSASAGLAVQFFCTLYLQNLLNLSPLQTGLAFVPVTAAIVLISSRAGRLVGRFGVRRMLVGTAALSALGLLLLAVSVATGDGTAAGGAYWTRVLPGVVVFGVGAGLGFAPAMIVATTGVRDDEQGLASGLLNTSFQLGAPLGLAALSAVSVYASHGGTGPGELAAGLRAAFLCALALPALTMAAVLALPASTSAGESLTDGGSVPDSSAGETRVGEAEGKAPVA
ncbi:MFS transporter, partial [Actinomadura sp. HBU206391]|uniref:MFS transporter n=1 Tax=Actinomadura sp. HBU206391 TaxID=2731692 RepID=UPI00164F48B9